MADGLNKMAPTSTTTYRELGDSTNNVLLRLEAHFASFYEKLEARITEPPPLQAEVPQEAEGQGFCKLPLGAACHQTPETFPTYLPQPRKNLAKKSQVQLWALKQARGWEDALPQHRHSAKPDELSDQPDCQPNTGVG
ncbi:Hypothetical predicted protein [Pelobates cultripes]|uniref:Uncharacterized protein n=1 Tax=Pelobates cultripes TaxID=61616 RepID=A0AAD1QWJ5_PELCU|nr:Hypothetical predicted protein [Pelobates cultripes]